VALETRTRITLLLPAPSTLPQFFLLDQVLDQLIAVCGGVTTSPTSGPSLAAYDSSLFAGRWFDAHTGETVSDANVFIFGDAPLLPDDPVLHEYLDSLKVACQQDFEQDIIWITLHAVDRIADNDYLR
jgi:hypothetical protein